MWTHQVEAVERAVAGLRGGGRGQIVMACGSGKTLVALRVTEELTPRAGIVVVLVPTLGLVAQTLTSWRQDARCGFAALAVCSDDTTVDAPVHVADLAGQVGVTTDPAVIGSWLAGTPHRRVAVGTYASAHRIAEALQEKGLVADVLVCDEAHRLAGSATAAAVGVVDDRVFPARRRLFVTATPRSDAQVRERGGDEVLSMDDPQVFGSRLYEYSFAQAIDDGCLKDYRIAVVGVADSEARRLMADRSASHVGPADATDLRVAAAQTALARVVRSYDLRRVITFHPRVADADEFARTLPATLRRLPDDGRPDGQVVATHIHGGMAQAARARVLDQLDRPPESGWVCVSNVRVLAEGLDTPGVDAILFTHPKKSTVDAVQAVGRALRRQPDGARTATIIVPILVPDVAERIDEGVVDPGGYQTLWQVVVALRAHDESLAAELDLRRSRLHLPNHSQVQPLPERVVLTVPDGLYEHTLATLSVQMVRHTTSPWWEGYGHAQDYHAHHGNLLVPGNYRAPDGYPLGQWISSRRKAYRKRWLDTDRINLLDKLDMVWQAAPPRDTSRTPEQKWYDNYQIAAAHHAEHGNLTIPRGEHRELAGWMRKQRLHRDQLTPDQVQALDRIGMVWDALDLRWRVAYAEAQAFHAEHGHLRVPYLHITETGHKLWTWVNQRRMDYHRGRLPAERIAALNDIGMEWTPLQARWDRAFTAAETYHAEHGNLDVPANYKAPDGFGLGWWLHHQRQLRTGEAPGGLTPDRITRLNTLGMIWKNTSDHPHG